MGQASLSSSVHAQICSHLFIQVGNLIHSLILKVKTDNTRCKHPYDKTMFEAHLCFSFVEHLPFSPVFLLLPHGPAYKMKKSSCVDARIQLFITKIAVSKYIFKSLVSCSLKLQTDRKLIVMQMKK